MSHFIYPNGVRVCARAFDEHGSVTVSRECARFAGVRPFRGSAPVASPQRCISRRDKRLPCEKPFTAPEAESCTGLGTRRVTRTIWVKRVNNKVSNTAGTLTLRGDHEQDFSSAGCYSGVNPSTVEHHAKHHIVSFPGVLI